MKFVRFVCPLHNGPNFELVRMMGGKCENRGLKCYISFRGKSRKLNAKFAAVGPLERTPFYPQVCKRDTCIHISYENKTLSSLLCT